MPPLRSRWYRPQTQVLPGAYKIGGLFTETILASLVLLFSCSLVEPKPRKADRNHKTEVGT